MPSQTPKKVVATSPVAKGSTAKKSSAAKSTVRKKDGKPSPARMSTAKSKSKTPAKQAGASSPKAGGTAASSSKAKAAPLKKSSEQKADKKSASSSKPKKEKAAPMKKAAVAKSPKATKARAKNKKLGPENDEAGAAAEGGASNSPKGAMKARPKKEKWPGALYGAYGEPRTAIPWPPAIRKAGGNFKLISWNVAGLRAFLKSPERVKQLKDVMLTSEKPDGVAFLETKLQTVHEDEASAQLLEILGGGFDVFFSSCTDEDKKGYSGVAFVVRKPASNSDGAPDEVKGGKLVQVRPVDQSGFEMRTAAAGAFKEVEGRVLVAEFAAFYCVIVYTPNSGAELKRLDYRVGTWDLAFRNLLKSLAQKGKGKGVVVIGDLNVAHLDEDIWNLNIGKDIEKQAGLTPEERNSFGKLLQECDLVDGFKKTVGSYAEKGEAGLGYFTYWSQRAKNKQFNRGLRLDYCLLSTTFADKHFVEGFNLPSCTAQFGDHCPIGISLKL
eukprot:g3323.t1